MPLMTSSASHRDRLAYIGIASITYLLFKHVIGPYVGLEDWTLTIGSYLFAIGIATGYLYLRIFRQTKPSTGDQ